MQKYKEYVDMMLLQNKSLFDNFKLVHDKYTLDQDSHQDEFNKIGEAVQTVIQDWENKLCMQSEKAGYGNYTKNLSEKFRAELKKIFPMIEYIGIVVKKFELKKIRLN